MEALLGSTAFGVSPLALPWGGSAHYMQPAGRRRGGKAALVRKPQTQLLQSEKVLLRLELKVAMSCSNLIRVVTRKRFIQVPVFTHYIRFTLSVALVNECKVLGNILFTVRSVVLGE